jgi:hypothetical protein
MIFFPGFDNLCKAHFILDLYGVSFGNLYHRYLAQNLIKIRLIVSKAKHVYMHIMLYYIHFIQIILKFHQCVLSSKELVSADMLISLLARGRYTKENKTILILWK